MAYKVFTDCVEFVGTACKPFVGTKKYISTGAVEIDHIIESDIELVDYEGKPSRANLEVSTGDILFAKMQGTKKTLAIDEALSNNVYSTGFCAVRAKKGFLTDRCLYHLLTSQFFLDQKDKNCSGATQKAITNAGLSKINVRIPDYSEQDGLADKLDALTKIIDQRQIEIQYLDDLIKARFVEMFGDCAEVVSAGVIMSEMRNGVSPSTNGNCPEKVLTLSAITQGHFDPSMWKDGLFDNPPAAEKRIHATDFYMCRGNGNKSLVGAGVYSKEDREDLVFPDTVIAARVDITRVCLPYLFIAWMQPSVRDQIEAGSRTTNGTYKINQQIISKINIPLPPLNAQEQFAAFVAQVDKSKFVVQQALDEAQLLFDSLMQKYFE